MYALVILMKKLHPYFQAHRIAVLTTQPMRAILHRSEILNRLAKWETKLREFNIRYQPRPAIKAQALVDLISKCTITEDLPKAKLKEGAPKEF